MGKKELEIGAYYQVKSLEQLKQEFSEYISDYGNLMLRTEICFNVKEMGKFCGRIGVAIDRNRILFCGDKEKSSWLWSSDMMIKLRMDDSMLTYKQRNGK